MEQKQWLLEHDQLWSIRLALGTEIDRQRAHGMDESRLHFQKLIELEELIKAVIGHAAWEHDEETGERIHPSERVLISLVPHSGEWWSDPYAVIPIWSTTIGKLRWAVVEKGSVRPVGEKTYSQKTHAYRRCRNLNAAARDAFEDKRGWHPTPPLPAETEARLTSELQKGKTFALNADGVYEAHEL